jgi:hypothetical protein
MPWASRLIEKMNTDPSLINETWIFCKATRCFVGLAITAPEKE